MTSPSAPTSSRPEARRVGRQLARFRALAERHRGQVRAARIARGGLGFCASLAAAIKFKLAVSLGAKLGLAVIVGLGFAWPGVALVLAALAVAVIALSEGSVAVCDCFLCESCARRNARRERLDGLIAERAWWLDGGEGTAPTLRRTAPHA